jgi:hypothetical protein
MRELGIAPRVRGLGTAFRAVFGLVHPGLKPGAILCDHFMVKIRCRPSSTNHRHIIKHLNIVLD